jgi:hypothetical protein
MSKRTEPTVVLTTINLPNKKIEDWSTVTENDIIVIGDNKTPKGWAHERCNFISIENQKDGPFTISSHLLENHYTRKNIGYLYALLEGANIIVDTDDDNFPYQKCWEEFLNQSFNIRYLKNVKEITYKNIYSYFSDDKTPFWPRGFPLNQLNNQNSKITTNDIISTGKDENIGIWQCMVDGDPDIDAIHRLIFNKTPNFKNYSPLCFGKNNLCSFNSQNTIWSEKRIFPLLYLPATVSFRFTDILRSYVAQLILYRTKYYLAFYPATSYQERNTHDIMSDFESEISMYQHTDYIVETLNDVIKDDISINDNLVNAYSSLNKIGIVDSLELKILDCWLNDITDLIK